MNRQECKALLPVMQAFAEGKEVEWRWRDGEPWRPTTSPGWNRDQQYRIKPEPMVVWVSVYEDGSVGVAYTKQAGDMPLPRPGVRHVRFVEQPE